MTIELNTFDLFYKTGDGWQPFDPDAFMAGLDDIYFKTRGRIHENIRLYGLTAARIARERNAIFPDTARVDVTSAWGVFIKIDLTKTEGFDAMHEYYEMLAWQTKNAHRVPDKATRQDAPDPEDYPEIKRRSWTFRIGDHHCTLAAFSPADSEVCRMVEDGTTPKYKLDCTGSAISRDVIDFPTAQE